MSSLRRIAAPLILCPYRLRIRNGILTFQDNRLVDICSVTPSELDSSASVEYYNGIIIPTWTNAHCHLELSYLYGQVRENKGLNGFICELDSVREKTCIVDRIAAASFRQSQMFAEGTSLVADICNDTYGLSLKCGSGIEYVNFAEMFGLESRGVNRAWNRGCEVLDLCSELGLTATPVPHSLYSVGDDLMAKISDFQRDIPLSVHFMEDAAETELFFEKGALYTRYKAADWSVDFIKDKSPAHRLIKHFAKEQPLLLVHNTFVKEEDVDLINSYFNSVCWVLSPRSNYYISRTEPPYELLRRKGCRIALGTDSLASNHTLSMCDEVRFIQSRHPEIPLEELVYWATVSGQMALKQMANEPTVEQMFDSGAVLIENVDIANERLLDQSSSRRLI